MRKYFLKAFLVICPIIFNTEVTAQTHANGINTNVILGTLDNGLTYYISRDTTKRLTDATLSLVVKAGKFSESLNEIGFSHFVEHLGFRSTVNFPNGLRNHLRGLGLSGSNFNASTGLTTNYWLHIPVVDSLVLESALLCLLDWASGRTYVPSEVEEERMAVLNELGQVNRRLFSETWEAPYLALDKNHFYKPLFYEEIESIKKVSSERLKTYDEQWYCPELMGIIIVGNIDEAYVEQKIKLLFSALKRCDHDPKSFSETLKKFDVPLTGRNKLVVHETSSNFVELKMAKKRKSITGMEGPTDEDQLHLELYDAMYFNLINARLMKMTGIEESVRRRIVSIIDRRAIRATASIDVLRLSLMVENVSEIKEVLMASVVELRRAALWGFDESEFLAAKNEIASNITHESMVGSLLRSHALVDHFVYGTIYNKEKKLSYLKEISIDQFNDWMKKWIEEDGNTDIMLGLPQGINSNIPNEMEIFSWISEAMKSSPGRYENNSVRTLPFPKLPENNLVLSSRIEVEAGVVKVSLKNGVEVYVKQLGTPEQSPRRNSVVLKAFKKKGFSAYTPLDYQSASMAPKLVFNSGISSLDNKSFRNWLNDKNEKGELYMEPYINNTMIGISGAASLVHTEDLFKLTYLYFKEPRFEKAEFVKLVAMQSNPRKPTQIFEDTVRSILFGSELTKMNSNPPDYKKAIKLYKEAFANAGDFTFVVTGFFEMDETIRLISKYFGNLPSKVIGKSKPPDMKVKTKDLNEAESHLGPSNVSMIADSTGNVFVRIVIPCTNIRSEREMFKLYALNQVISTKLFNRLRQQEKLVYGVASSLHSSIMEGKYALDIEFQLRPENLERAVESVIEEIATLSEKGIEPEIFNSAMNKTRNELVGSLKSSRYWAEIISLKVISGEQFDDPSLMLRNFDSVTVSDLLKASKDLIKTDDFSLFKLY